MGYHAIRPFVVATTLLIARTHVSIDVRAQASTAAESNADEQPGENGLVTTGRRIMKLFSQPLHPVVWKDIDATVFLDAGKVARRPADLDRHDLKESYGFSLSYMRGDTALGRIDAGFGGGEGAAVFVSVGI